MLSDFLEHTEENQITCKCFCSHSLTKNHFNIRHMDVGYGPDPHGIWPNYFAEVCTMNMAITMFAAWLSAESILLIEYMHNLTNSNQG